MIDLNSSIESLDEFVLKCLSGYQFYLHHLKQLLSSGIKKSQNDFIPISILRARRFSQHPHFHGTIFQVLQIPAP